MCITIYAFLPNLGEAAVNKEAFHGGRCATNPRGSRCFRQVLDAAIDQCSSPSRSLKTSQSRASCRANHPRALVAMNIEEKVVRVRRT